MDVETFVSEALEQLGASIEKVRGKSGIKISPSPYMQEGSNTAGDRLVEIGTGKIVSFVEFDLSVTVTKRVEGEAGAKLQVVGIDFGGAGVSGGLDHTRVQRIKFQVPVSFPASRESGG